MLGIGGVALQPPVAEIPSSRMQGWCRRLNGFEWRSLVSGTELSDRRASRSASVARCADGPEFAAGHIAGGAEDEHEHA
jgi:hypothetical protein